MTLVLAAWLVWAAVQTCALVAAPWVSRARGRGPFCNGLTVVVPAATRARCERGELAALVAHECGHLVHGHAWINLALRCFFVPPWRALRERQELEADAFAAAHADPVALASAIRKLSFNQFDWHRAALLERSAGLR